MKKLYSVKEITQMLNAELEASNIDYRYTEERVRARLRYLRSKATSEAQSLHVEPKIYGYDRRAKYYTEEDVERLKAVWIGPMLPEFTEHPEDLPTTDSEIDEIEVREAKTSDLNALAGLYQSLVNEEADIKSFIARMIREANGKTFVAFNVKDEILGWSHAEISFSATVARGILSGIIRIFVLPEHKERKIIARFLLYRADWWLSSQNVKHIDFEIPATFQDLGELFESMSLEEDPDTKLMHIRNE